MKTLKNIFAALFLITIAVVNVNAQNVTTAEAEASATIIAPLTLTKVTDLSFGNVASGSDAGTVVLSTAGARTESGVVLPSVEGTVSAAQFTVGGLTGATYEITLPTSITISNGTNNMTVDTFVHDADEILDSGNETFNVGATLKVGADQAAGSYSGDFDVTVDYN